MRGLLLTLGFAVAVLLTSQPTPADEKTKDDGYVNLFNGKNLDGWHVSAKTGHSRASKQQMGGKWVVDNGVMEGSQDIRGNDGIVYDRIHRMNRKTLANRLVKIL